MYKTAPYLEEHAILTFNRGNQPKVGSGAEARVKEEEYVIESV